MSNTDFETEEIMQASRRITVKEVVTLKKYHRGIPNGKFVMVYKESLKAYFEECKKGNLHQADSTLLMYCLCNMNEKNEVELHYSQSKEKLGLGKTAFAAARRNLEKMKILSQKASGQSYIVNFATLRVNGRFASIKEMEWNDFARCPALCGFDGNILQIGIEPQLQIIERDNEKLQEMSQKMEEFGKEIEKM